MLFDLPTLSWPEVLLRLALAAVLGAAIGIERELREREAGLRTHLLVCLGSALFTIASAYGFRGFLEHGGSVVRARTDAVCMGLRRGRGAGPEMAGTELSAISSAGGSAGAGAGMEAVVSG